MRFYLDGKDWEADYFIPNEDFTRWQMAPWNLKNMLLDCATSAGFTSLDNGYLATYQATVPGCDRSVLLENHEIPDPYFDRNLEKSRWAEKVSWGFRKRFLLPDSLQGKKRLVIHFCGIDYTADFYLNGCYLGKHTGAFIPFEADVTDAIRHDEENLLAVVFDPMPQALPNHADPYVNQPTEFSNYHRCQSSYGWDWSRAMPATGIWDHVYLEAYDEARITDSFFRGDANGKAELSLSCHVQTPGTYELKIKLEPFNFQGRSFHFTESLELQAGDNGRALQFKCPKPELWYPNGYGKPSLYWLTLELDGDLTRQKVAFRTLEMKRNPGSPEGAYNQTFVINGQPVFARGSNWVPADLMHSRCSQQDYERLVRLAAESHANLFRVWGGGIIEKEEFYDACDRHGILVWQEFMHACSNYRKDPEYLAFKAREAKAVLRKLRRHPSVSLICGGNEIFYYGEIPDSPLLLQYEKLTHELAPDLPFHFSCPDKTRPGERDHGPWHFIDHDCINGFDRLIASEVGCTGFAEFESVQKFIPEKDLGNFAAQSWKYHFAYPCRLQDYHEQLKPFDTVNTWQRCQAIMATQADVNSYWISHYRRKFPHSTGCFIWQYNEPWPTLALSLVDYYTLPKIAYYQLQRVQCPIALSLRDNSWFCRDGKFEAELFLTADQPTGPAEFSFRLLTADGRELLKRSLNGDYPAGSLKLSDLAATLPEDLPAGVVLAEMKITANGQAIYENVQFYGVPDFKGVFNAAKPAISAVAEIVPAEQPGEKLLKVKLTCNKMAAFNLRLNLPGIDYRQVYWHDNYLTLVPGETTTATASLTGEIGADAFLEVSAWNLPATIITTITQ